VPPVLSETRKPERLSYKRSTLLNDFAAKLRFFTEMIGGGFVFLC